MDCQVIDPATKNVLTKRPGGASLSLQVEGWLRR